MSFGAWLREARAAKQLTLRDLADLVGCSPAHLNNYELQPEKRPSVQDAERIARALGRSGEEGRRAAGYAATSDILPEALELDRILRNLPVEHRSRMMDAIRSMAGLTEPRDGHAVRRELVHASG